MNLFRGSVAAVVCGTVIFSTVVWGQDFGDLKSSTLTSKAWAAYGSRDYKNAVVYAKKCIELYEAEAQKMQTELTDYPTGAPEDVHKYWALNDVATSYYILGMSLKGLNDKEGAQEAFGKVVNDYKFGQCWDPKGWFWKPADEAQKELQNL